MSFSHPNRPAMKPDLTRWNRAGLSKFEYVDGDAAVWLEELRIAMLGLYLRGAEAQQRTPEHWRDVYLQPEEDWPDSADAAARVEWKRLAPAIPPQRESRGRRNERLLQQYRGNSGDYSWEINRAFARATHVLLGYLDTYANEGYLRTATQWDNLRRLAAMVNYQPTPHASATTTLALLLKQDSSAVEIVAGLAMKHTPPEGGAPLVFETLEKLLAHPALNQAHSVAWNENPTNIVFSETSAPIAWHLPEKDSLAPGDLLVLANGDVGEAHSIDTVNHDLDTQQALITFAHNPVNAFPLWSARLHTGPADVRVGLRQSKNGGVVVEISGGAGFVKGDIIEVFSAGVPYPVEILDIIGGDLILNIDLSGADEVTLRPMFAFALDDENKALADKAIGEMHFLRSGGIFKVTGSATPMPEDDDEFDASLSNTFSPGATITRRGHAPDNAADTIVGIVKQRTPEVLSGKPVAPARTVSFEGKPPKGLAEGDWFVARDRKTDALKALRVEGNRVSADEYHIQFEPAPDGEHEDTEFHGPFKQALKAVGYDRNPHPVMSAAKAVLSNIPEMARVLLKPGHKVIVSRNVDGVVEDKLATLTAVTPRANDEVEISVAPTNTAAGWAKGDTSFYLNTAMVSHGETKGSKNLGSGDGERAAQVFEFPVADITHIPSATAESGVIPDIDLAVDGERWDYRDYIDPGAEGTRSWSTTLTDEGKLNIHFRRRLVTGRNNVVVVRHRVGAGLAGTGIARFSFDKPMKKHRYVEAVYQPFETSGGADREPVSQLRQSAPSRLAANGRAVSLSDFEHLAMRNAAIWRAHAEEVPTPTAVRRVELTLVPAGGALLTDTLKADLRRSILNKCIPGVSVSFRAFETLPLHLGVTVRADLTVIDKTEIKAAAEAALAHAFSLEIRDFGQTAYVSEVLATLESVAGIENALATRFDLGDSYDLFAPEPHDFDQPWPRNVATRDDKVAAIYATVHQVIHIRAADSGAIAVLVEDIQ